MNRCAALSRAGRCVCGAEQGRQVCGLSRGVREGEPGHCYPSRTRARGFSGEWGLTLGSGGPGQGTAIWDLRPKSAVGQVLEPSSRPSPLAGPPCHLHPPTHPHVPSKAYIWKGGEGKGGKEREWKKEGKRKGGWEGEREEGRDRLKEGHREGGRRYGNSGAERKSQTSCWDERVPLGS